MYVHERCLYGNDLMQFTATQGLKGLYLSLNKERKRNGSVAKGDAINSPRTAIPMATQGDD